jgi:hypothetical protein
MRQEGIEDNAFVVTDQQFVLSGFSLAKEYATDVV